MSVARVTELISASKKSFEDAIQVGVSRAVQTLKNVEGVWVANQKCVIKDGKIEGDKITFVVSFDFGGMPLDIAYSGTVTPQELKMTADVLGMTMDFVVTKEK